MNDHKVDRSRWGSGPWDNEPNRLEWRDEATGLPCLIVRSDLGALCGYVGAPPGHPWHGKHYDDVPVEVHGGLTYSNPCAGPICHVSQPGEPDDVWWLGFDCAHYGDCLPFRIWELVGLVGEDGMYRDVDYVRAEVASLAAQVYMAGLLSDATG